MRVLIVSPAYPPMSSVGVVRVSSLSSYLATNGDKVTVICDKPNEQNSNGKAIFIPQGIDIIRIPASGSIKQIVKQYCSCLHELLNKEHFDIALLTVGPYFTLRFCPEIFKKYEISYIVDFRDVGACDKIYATNPVKWIKIAAARIQTYKYEYAAIRGAKYVVSVTEGWCSNKKRYFPLYAKKMFVIANGFDDERLKSFTPVNTGNDNHTVAIMGKMAYYSKEHAEMFFRAMEKLSDKYPDIKLLHICDPEKEIDDILENLHLQKSAYEVTGFLDYLDGMTRLSEAAALLVVDKRKYAMGTKLYDYIYMNRPILYAGSRDTAISKVTESFSNGFSCQTEEQIIRSVDTIFKDNLSTLDEKIDLSVYSRSGQNRKYRKLICSTISEITGQE